MRIPIKTNTEKFYIQVVELLSSFAPINKLFPKERKIVAELMYQNYLYRNIPEQQRWIILFSAENRKFMQEKLNISESALNVYFSSMRKAKILTDDNKLSLFLTKILPNKEYEFTILFTINEE